MELVDWFGYAAAICTTISFLPQVIKVIQTSDTQALSLSMYITFVIGITFWLVYGIFKGDVPIIAANVVTLILSSIILAMKVKNYKKDKEAELDTSLIP